MGHMEVYDAVVSLMGDLELLLSSFDRPKRDCALSKEDIEILHQNVSLIDNLLRDSNVAENYNRRLIQQFGERILHLVRRAGNYVDSNISAAAFLGFGDGMENVTERFPSAYVGWDDLLQQIAADVDNIHVQVKTLPLGHSVQPFKGGIGSCNELCTMDSSHPSLTQEGKWVGLEEEILDMLNKLIGGGPELKAYAVTGLDGSGKTTFARRLYEHPLTVSNFHIRAWITLSQKESLKVALKRLYAAFDVYHLRYWRYLIVVDNISINDWKFVKKLSVGNNYGSRIILTSRHQISTDASFRYLNPTESWILLHSKVFKDHETCPSELSLVGKEIADKCQGFPLAILVMGRLLSTVDKTSVIWEEVARRLIPLKDAVQSQNLVDFTNSYLLNQLKNLFHFMGFPLPDSEILTKQRNSAVAFQFRTSAVAEETSHNDTELSKIHDLKQFPNKAGKLQNGSTASTNLNQLHCLKLPFEQQDRKNLVLNPEVFASNASVNRDVMLVGLEKELGQLLECLTEGPSDSKMVLIRGIGGIGKTTFARKLYEHPVVVDQFSFRAWVTLTQEHQLQHVPSEFLRCISKFTDMNIRDSAELKAELHEILKGKRYLIVLDDICQRVYDNLRFLFPSEMNGSRIILTWRLQLLREKQGVYYHHNMCGLNPHESWKLLCANIFSSVTCPIELRPIGKEIAKQCRGIPMVIVLVGGLLSKMDKTKTVWKEVARCVGTLVIEDFQIGQINNHLLYQLKACFLNMGSLPAEDHRIQVQRIFFGNAPQKTLQKMVLEMSHFINKLKKIRRDHILQKPSKNVEDCTSSHTGSELLTMFNPSLLSPNKEAKLIGLGEEFEEILSCLIGQPSHLKVIGFTGMAGIGKTTFSKRLYDHPCVLEYFYVHAWVTVSQQYQLKNVLLGLLSCLTNISADIYEWSEEELTERLYRSLKGQRYLIVLDDMWDPKAWDDLRRVFPDDNNGSRIILTSRLRDLCTCSSSRIEPHMLRFLSPSESWELLCSKIFQNGSCPPDLVTVGMKIANKCQGLPLALVVVGGLLSEVSKTFKAWEGVAKNVASLVMEDSQQCQNILALSYNQLSDRLKACFLYMGNFPEDHEIHGKKLMCLWMAEGLISPMKEKSLEEVAEMYLESLISRSLVMVKRRSSNGRIKTCCIHDLMRDFCLREAKKEKFLCIINSCTQEPLVDLLNQKRVIFHSGIRKYMSPGCLVTFTGARSFFCYEPLGPTDLKSCSGMYFKLLRILDISSLHLESLPVELVSLTHLRYLAITIQDFLSISELFRLHSLQALFVCCKWDGHLPEEFWKMLELRHLYLKGSCVFSVLVNKIHSDRGPLDMLDKLQTLSTIRPINCTEKVFRSMPNLRNLGIYETEDDHRFRGWTANLVFLEELETLKYVFFNPFARPSFRELHPSWGIVFPPNLMKLTLSGTCLPWEDMIHLSLLPNLEVLKLKNYAFTGPLWELKEGGFLGLRFLLIGSTNLEQWEAEYCPFPRLQHLVLRHCKSLEEIPGGIGEAPLIEKIELHCCSHSAAISARNIQAEQRDYGNAFLTVYVTQGPNGNLNLSGTVQDEEDAPISRGDDFMWTDVASTSRVNEASYTSKNSQVFWGYS